MATNSRRRTEFSMENRCQVRETGPGRNTVWMERKSKDEQKVPVVYYLFRNGQLEHPHFLEVPVSSPQGLFLKDFISKLNTLRGDGMAKRFSWSSKRSYKNGFVWQDLSENDFIHPCHGSEYILKGSLLLESSQSFRSSNETVSSTSKNSSEIYSSSEGSNVVPKSRKKHHSWSEFKELDEHKIYKATISREFSRKGYNVSTQTDSDDGRQEMESNRKNLNMISADIRDQSVKNDRPSGRMKASAVLMQLVACGSKRVKDWESMETRGKCGPNWEKVSKFLD